MGMEWFRRPIYAPSVTARSTDKTPGSGAMLADKFIGQPVAPSSAIQAIASTASAVSTAAALTAITAHAQLVTITTTGSGAGYECKLSTGRTVGTTVTIQVAANSTVPTTILLESTTQVLFGSTFNALTFSTDSSGTAATLTKVSTGAYVGVWDAAKVTPGGSTGTV